MTPFIHNDFLLKTGAARHLYHEYAEDLPIIDYHSHLDPADLANDRCFENITQIWITTDPCKHRAMRIHGVPEHLITGDASDRDRFNAWAHTAPATIGNPLFHWTALELERCFGITKPLSPATADSIWNTCNEFLKSPEFSARSIIRRANVEYLCTTDLPGDDLAHHTALAGSDFPTRVIPTPRIDDADAVDPATISASLDRFDALGCKLADHPHTRFGSTALRHLACEYGRRGWTMQLHTSSRHQPGTDSDIPGLRRFIDEVAQHGTLPRLVIYPLNPADYPALANLTGTFTQDGTRGKIQLGPAWWHNDHTLGILNHLDTISTHSLLSAFIGTTTGSRSPLAMTRHEYFRRILCDWLGDRVEAGTLPKDAALLGSLVTAVCHHNARHVFLT